MTDARLVRSRTTRGTLLSRALNPNQTRETP